MDGMYGAPKGIRTPVTGVRGQRPRPLDDGSVWSRRTAPKAVLLYGRADKAPTDHLHTGHLIWNR